MHDRNKTFIGIVFSLEISYFLYDEESGAKIYKICNDSSILRKRMNLKTLKLVTMYLGSLARIADMGI